MYGTFETLSVKLMEYLGTGGPESSEGSIAGRGEEEGDSPGESGPDDDDDDDDGDGDDDHNEDDGDANDDNDGDANDDNDDDVLFLMNVLQGIPFGDNGIVRKIEI